VVRIIDQPAIRSDEPIGTLPPVCDKPFIRFRRRVERHALSSKQRKQACDPQERPNSKPNVTDYNNATDGDLLNA
jgi:hypothetical protein